MISVPSFQSADTTVRDAMISTRSFQGALGGSEHFITIQASAELDFAKQVAFVEGQYQEAQQNLGLAPATAIFRRIFLSDVLNQAALVRESELAADSAAISIVQQPPLPGSKIGLLAYHIASPDPVTKLRLSPRHLLVKNSGQRHLWSTRLCTRDAQTAISSEAQTRAIFNDLVRTLKEQGATLREHCVRTWIYMKDVDVFYKGMVNVRRELFREHGLTGDTHYIASTGIEGACAHRFDLVTMDAYCNLDLVAGQVSYLNDFEQLCATQDYNVTFERGTRVAYADRAHCFISGTASIDKDGNVVHPGDVLRQAERTLDNMEALLHAGSATLADLMYLIVYLRDPTDFVPVHDYFCRRLPALPMIFVQGAVCRPEWLIEAEGIAITQNHQPELPCF